MTTTPTTPATVSRSDAAPVDLLPCPCGAPCDADEGPYSVDFTGTLFRLNCQNADCGWCCISPTREMCRTDWNRRAIDRRGGVDETMDIIRSVMLCGCDKCMQQKDAIEAALGLGATGVASAQGGERG